MLPIYRSLSAGLGGCLKKGLRLGSLNRSIYSFHIMKAEPEELPENDIMFIRHAHSEFNQACQSFRKKHGIEYDWNKLVTYEGFNDTVAYNRKYIDCSITARGVAECDSIRQQLKNTKVDLILVSPHQRTLQTCARVFGHRETRAPIVVQPLLAGSFWSVCDIGNSLVMKNKMFSQFDFSKCNLYNDLWYAENISKDSLPTVTEEIKKAKVTGYRDIQKVMLKLLRENKIAERSTQLRSRAARIKQLLRKMKQKYQNIAVVSHYYNIQYVNTTDFDKTDTPTDKVDIQNCSPYFSSFEALMKNR